MIGFWDGCYLNNRVGEFLGWKKHPGPYSENWIGPNGETRNYGLLPQFIDDTNLAMQAVRRLHDIGYTVEMTTTDDGYLVTLRNKDGSVVVSDEEYPITGDADTLSEAITLVVAKLRGHYTAWEVEEKIAEYRKAKAAGTKYAAVFKSGDDLFIFKNHYIGCAPDEALDKARFSTFALLEVTPTGEVVPDGVPAYEATVLGYDVYLIGGPRFEAMQRGETK